MMKFKEILIDEIEHSELDLEYPFYGPAKDKEGDDIRNDIDYMNTGTYSESPSIDIDIVIDSLRLLKAKGANRVYLVDHGDHHGYVITGVKLEEL